MTQPAFDIDTFSVTRHAEDPRADGARRTVKITATAVTIERTVDGVRMRLGVPVSAYRGLTIAVRAPSGGASLTLRHDDSDFDVALFQGSAEAIARIANAWSRALGKAITVEEACVTIRAAQPRGRVTLKAGRRSRFARRRKLGVAARLTRSFSHEDEIIARH